MRSFIVLYFASWPNDIIFIAELYHDVSTLSIGCFVAKLKVLVVYFERKRAMKKITRRRT